MDPNLNPGRSNREHEQPRQRRHQPQGGGPPPQAQPPRQEMGGQPPQQSPPPRGGQQPPQQGMQSGQGMSHQGGQQGMPPQQQPPHQQGRQPRQGGMQSHEGMGAQQPPQQGRQSAQAMPPQQGMQQSMGGQGMGGPGTGAQRRLPVEPVGAEAVSPDEVVTASPDDPVTSLVEKMDQADVGTVVVTEDRRPVGLVTDRAIAKSLLDQPDVSDVTAEDVMTEDLVTIGQDETMFDAIRTLGDSGIRRAPIVDDEGNLAGIVSSDDAIVLLAEELNQVGEAIEKQIERL